jgi:hypothetical protein
LKRFSATTEAEVVETRVSSDSHGLPNYDIRYRFRTQPLGPWFTREEPATGRSDLWSVLPQEEWERARGSGRLTVAYVPDDPHINRPASTQSSSATDSLAGLIIGLVLLVGGSCWIVVAAARWVLPEATAVVAVPASRR